MAKLTRYQLDALTAEITKQINEEIDSRNKIILDEKSDEIEQFRKELENSDIVLRLKDIIEKQEIINKLQEEIKELKFAIAKLDNKIYPYNISNDTINKYINNIVEDKFLLNNITSNEIQQEIILSDLTSSNNLNLQELIDSIKAKFIG